MKSGLPAQVFYKKAMTNWIQTRRDLGWIIPELDYYIWGPTVGGMPTIDEIKRMGESNLFWW